MSDESEEQEKGDGVDEAGEGPARLDGQVVLEELGVLKSRAVQALLEGSEKASAAFARLGGPTMLTTGSSRCSCCTCPDHDVLMFGYWRGEVSSVAAGSACGVTKDRWTQHEREHVPNYQVLRELAKVGGGRDMRRLLVELRDEALGLMDEFERCVMLRRNVVVLQATLLGLVQRGISGRPDQAHAVTTVTGAIMVQTREVWKAEQEASDWAAKRRREVEGDAAGELERLKSDLRALFQEDPDIAARVNDLIEGKRDG